MKILILDNNVNRLKSTKKEFISIYPERIKLDARTSITREECEKNGYFMILVHKNNVESDDIDEQLWNIEDAKIIIFSGGYSAIYKRPDGVILCPVNELINEAQKIIKGD